MTQQLFFVYVTCADAAEAEKIAAHLIENGLAACANIMAPHRAVYRWEGKIENAAETAMILKTTPELFDEVRQAILARHSYACPCIVGWAADKGHPAFLEWISSCVGR